MSGTDLLQQACERLPGSWYLQCWDIRYDDGRAPSYPFGPDAAGLIVYTHDGSMSACIARAARAPLSSESVRSAPVAEQLAAFESYFQYAGAYHLREQDGGVVVVHEVQFALNPNFVGSQQVRRVQLDADGGLTLSASDRLPGQSVLRHHRLQWRRA